MVSDADEISLRNSFHPKILPPHNSKDFLTYTEMDFFGRNGGFFDDPFTSRRSRDMERLRRQRKREEQRLRKLKRKDEIVFSRALARIVSKNPREGKESLDELKKRLLQSKSNEELEERVTVLLSLGLAVLLNSLEEYEMFFEIRQDLGRIVRAVFPHGYPRRIHRSSRQKFNDSVREMQQLFDEHGPIDVDADSGNFIKAPKSVEEQDDEESDHQEQQQQQNQQRNQQQQQQDTQESTDDQSKTMARTFSVASEAALEKLAKFRDQLDAIQSKVDMINARLSIQSDGDTQDKHLGKFKSELGLLNGRVDKLQFSGIDSVMVGPLTSGKGDARALRKKLNMQASELSKLIKDIHKRIGKDLFYRSMSHEDS